MYVSPLIHLITFFIGALTGSFVGSFTGACLTAAQLITFILSSVRSCVKPETARRLEWYEDVLSFSLTTVAVAHLERSIHVDWIIFLVSVVTAQSLVEIPRGGSDVSNIAIVASHLLWIGNIVFLGFASWGRPTYWTYLAVVVLGAIFVRSERRYAFLPVFYVRYFAVAGVGTIYLALGASVLLAVGVFSPLRGKRGYQRRIGGLVWSDSGSKTPPGRRRVRLRGGDARGMI